jgi:hypothetical protein
MDHLSDHQCACLRVLQDLYEVSAALGTCTFVWGGLVADILCSEFLRAHHDVDGFVLNLLNVKEKMAARFAERGYAVSYQDIYDLLRIDKCGLHAVFNRLEIDGHRAMWRHVGDQGTVFFPAHWLDAPPRSFYGVPVHISGVQFEYAIKACPRLLNPQWKLRDKDRTALALLEAELDRLGLDRAQVLAEIWSETPYWAERGHPEYAHPIGAIQPPTAIDPTKRPHLPTTSR